MSRFKNEFAKMETVTPAARSDAQTLAALLALVCFLLILWAWRASPDEASPEAPPASPAVGALSKWIVADAASSEAGCQQAACEYLAVHPVSDLPTTQVLARHLPPPPVQLSAPDGYLFRPQRHSGPVYTRYRHHQTRVAFALPVLFPAELSTSTLSSVVNLPVDYPGYVLWAKPPAQAASGERPPVDTSGTVRHITFQPFDSLFQVQLDAPPPYPVASGDTLAVRFLGGAESETISLPLASAFEPVRVTAVQADPAGQRWTLDLAMRDDEQALKVLDQRMSLAQFSDAPVLAASVVLEFHLKQEAGAGQPMRLPATAVIRQGAQSRVWLALEGAAVPVTVKELQRLPDWVLVTEVAGARDLPIERPDWLALGARLRRDSLRSASAQGASDNNRLLTAAALVIVRPDAALRPATAVKVRYAPADTRPDTRAR